MSEIQDCLSRIRPADARAMCAARARWDSIAKPLHSLGLLEDAIVRIAGIFGTPQISLDKRAVVIFCADNGVVAEGVTQTGSDVTAVVTENFAHGQTSVCVMARLAQCDVIPVDIGVARPVNGDGIWQCNLARGTGNIARGPAMSRELCEEAVLLGIRIAGELKKRGYRLLCTGEMGIGNTTTSSAVASVLLGRDPEELTGRGAGLSGEGLRRKVDAIRRAIAVNRPDPKDAIDTLSKVGGLDLAGLCGLFLGGAVHRIPIVVDGFISSAAALAAIRIAPAAQEYLLASHVSGEKAGALLLEQLGLSPMITAGMCLGEGTGAVASLGLLDMAAEVYRTMSTFEEIDIEAYTPQE